MHRVSETKFAYKSARNTTNHLDWGNLSQSVRIQFLFLCEVAASKCWCYISGKFHTQNWTPWYLQFTTWRWI